MQTFLCEMMIRTGSAAEAIDLLSQSLQMLEKSFAASPTDEIAHFRIANVQAELGKGYAALAADGGKREQNRLTEWREARSWFHKSREIYKQFLDAGRLTGEDAVRLDVVNEGIARSEAAIDRLSGNNK